MRDYKRVTALEVSKNKRSEIYSLALKVGRFNVLDPYFWDRESLAITENYLGHYNKTEIMWFGRDVALNTKL